MGSVGVNRLTGRIIRDDEHIAQSIAMRLTTPKASRLFRRWLGSDVPSRIDAPMDDPNILALFVDVSEALQGETRFELRRVGVPSASADGRLSVALAGIIYPNGHKGDRTPSNGGAIVPLVIALTQV